MKVKCKIIFRFININIPRSNRNILIYLLHFRKLITVKEKYKQTDKLIKCKKCKITDMMEYYLRVIAVLFFLF